MMSVRLPIALSAVFLFLMGLVIRVQAQSMTPNASPNINQAPAQQAATPAQPTQQPAPAQPPTQPPTTPSGPKPGSWSISGLLDFYYSINFRNPRGSDPSSPYYPAASGVPLASGGFIKVDNALRFNDINNRGITFSLGELDLVRSEDKKLPIGAHITLTTGEEPLIFHATEPGNPYAWENFHNLYIYHTFDVAKHDVEVDTGIWASPFGLEVIENPQDDNYSRGILFVLSPFYHAGIRAKSNLTPKVSLEFAVVNGWNDVANDTGVLDEYFQFVIKPDARFTQIVSFIGGNDSVGPYGRLIAPRGTSSIDTAVLDLNSIYQVSHRLKLSGWIDFGNASGESQERHLSGSWLGLAGYAKYQLNGRVALAGRIEQFEDYAGVGGIGLRFGAPGYTKYNEITLTAEYAAFRGHLITRLEYRHDHANQQFFGFGSALGPDQDTITLGEIYKF
jgi:hypothetical protein